MKKRRPHQRRDDEEVGGEVGGEGGGTDFVGDPEPAVDLHRARVASLHFGQKLRGVLLLQQDAAHTALAKINSKREAYRSCADDDDLRIQTGNSEATTNFATV